MQPTGSASNVIQSGPAFFALCLFAIFVAVSSCEEMLLGKETESQECAHKSHRFAIVQSIISASRTEARKCAELLISQIIPRHAEISAKDNAGG